jgi:hypothetical protein
MVKKVRKHVEKSKFENIFLLHQKHLSEKATSKK